MEMKKKDKGKLYMESKDETTGRELMSKIMGNEYMGYYIQDLSNYVRDELEKFRYSGPMEWNDGEKLYRDENKDGIFTLKFTKYNFKTVTSFIPHIKTDIILSGCEDSIGYHLFGGKTYDHLHDFITNVLRNCGETRTLKKPEVSPDYDMLIEGIKITINSGSDTSSIDLPDYILEEIDFLFAFPKEFANSYSKFMMDTISTYLDLTRIRLSSIVLKIKDSLGIYICPPKDTNMVFKSEDIVKDWFLVHSIIDNDSVHVNIELFFLRDKVMYSDHIMENIYLHCDTGLDQLDTKDYYILDNMLITNSHCFFTKQIRCLEKRLESGDSLRAKRDIHKLEFLLDFIDSVKSIKSLKSLEVLSHMTYLKPKYNICLEGKKKRLSPRDIIAYLHDLPHPIIHTP